MEKSLEAVYKEFEEKVKRTICIDYVSPQASESVLQEAFNQFGTVRSICFIPNYLGPSNRGKSVLIEMDDVKQASDVVSTINKFPFMICGMPRPVQARAAEKEMFADRPANPGRKVKCAWLEPTDPNFKAAQKLKLLARKHSKEAAFLLKKQIEEEEKLAAQQIRNLKTHFKKFETLDSVIAEGSMRGLANRYNLNVGEE